MTRRSSVDLRQLSPEKREHIAENMKERIYATITLLAVMAGLWQSAASHTVTGSILIIIGTVTALWLATLISARMSYRAVHNRPMNAGEYRKLLFTSSGLFAPSIPPILFIFLSAAGLVTLKTALMIGMILLAFSLFVLSLMGGWRLYESRLRLLLISSLELLLGVGVIVLKLVLGE